MCVCLSLQIRFRSDSRKNIGPLGTFFIPVLVLVWAIVIVYALLTFAHVALFEELIIPIFNVFSSAHRFSPLFFSFFSWIVSTLRVFSHVFDVLG